VEIVGGQETDEDTLRASGAFYRSLAMRPLLVPVEIDGYISDRLQQVLFHEALYMIEAGVCTPAEIDAAITGGPGLRWAFLGPMLTFHLAGGEGGIRHSMAHWAPEVANRWTHLPAPDFTEKLVNATAAGCEEIQAGRSIKEFERRRDRCLVEIQRALDEFWFPPDQDGWPDMPQ
jgi:carnitine 3-dehydrogenase